MGSMNEVTTRGKFFFIKFEINKKTVYLDPNPEINPNLDSDPGDNLDPDPSFFTQFHYPF